MLTALIIDPAEQLLNKGILHIHQQYSIFRTVPGYEIDRLA